MMEEWFDNGLSFAEIEKEIKKLNYVELYNLLEAYNWDDGFRIPALILKHRDCDLALAMEIFILAGGPDIIKDYLIDNKEVEEYNKEYWHFCLNLFNDMGAGKFKDSATPQSLDVGLKILLIKKGIINNLTKDFEFLM